MRLSFNTLDVFTDRRFGGNPLAVVHGADGLTDAQMQGIAREFNLSETVFLLPAENPAHSARVRIFTPAKELPFAGHPTVGTAALLAEMKFEGGPRDADALIVLEQGIGTIRVGVRLREDAAPFAEFDAPRLPVEAGTLPPVDLLAAGLGLIPSEIGFENHRPVCYAAGNAFAFIPVTTREAMGRARVNGAHWSAAFQEQGIVGAYLYTRQCEHKTSSFHARMFAPDAGVPEDPATGSAAVCFAGVIDRFDDLPDGPHRRTIEQGFEMGRPSFLSLMLIVEGQRLTGVRIGGHVMRVSEGTLHV
jgi:trans-2,3-dihydro-3-hydroxyanthranilate isomerase